MRSMHRFLTGSGRLPCVMKICSTTHLHRYIGKPCWADTRSASCNFIVAFCSSFPALFHWYVTLYEYGLLEQRDSTTKKNELIIFWQLCYFSRAKKLFDTVLLDAVRLCNCWHCNCMHKKIFKVDIALNALLFYFRWIQWISRILAVLYAAIYWRLFGTAAAKLVSSNLHLLP